MISWMLVNPVFCSSLNNADTSQCTKYDAAIAVGFGSPFVMDYKFNSAAVTTVTLGLADYSKIEYTPIASFSFRYFLRERINLRTELSYQKVIESLYAYGDFQGKRTIPMIGLSTGMEYRFLKQERFQLYGGLSIGYQIARGKYEGDRTYYSDKDFSAIAYQVTPLGVRLGGPFAFFFELGYGHKGIFNFGLSLQF